MSDWKKGFYAAVLAWLRSQQEAAGVEPDRMAVEINEIDEFVWAAGGYENPSVELYISFNDNQGHLGSFSTEETRLSILIEKL